MLVPTYHCPTMIAPVVALDVEPVFYPIGAEGGAQIEWLERQPLEGVRALLAAHYFGLPQPMQAEAWRSETSLSNISAALASAESLWRGVDKHGIRSLLDDDQKALAEKIDAGYSEARGKLDALRQPLGELLASEEGRQQVNDFYDSLDRVQRLHSGELAKALGVQLGFNANDGD